jgi:putative membrane protein
MMSWYGGVLVLHIVSVISWMAGLLYTPRLFVYHSMTAPHSETAATFEVMERKLLHAITIPAGIATFLFGSILASEIGLSGQGWLSAKLFLVLLLAIYTGMLEKWRRDFVTGRPVPSTRLFRMINEIPAVLMIGIVALVVLKPF